MTELLKGQIFPNWSNDCIEFLNCLKEDCLHDQQLPMNSQTSDTQTFLYIIRRNSAKLSCLKVSFGLTDYRSDCGVTLDMSYHCLVYFIYFVFKILLLFRDIHNLFIIWARQANNSLHGKCIWMDTVTCVRLM